MSSGLKFFSLRNKHFLERSFKENEIFRRTVLPFREGNVVVEDISTGTGTCTGTDTLNADTSLSNIKFIETRYQFKRNFLKATPEAGEIKIFYKYCVMFLKFYHRGIKDVWNNWKLVNKLEKEYYVNNKDLIPGVKNQHEKIRIKNGRQLVKIMSNVVKNYENEYKATKDINRFFDRKENTISITRSEFMTWLRTEKDVWKLPIFGVLFLVLEELTVLFCAIFPDITPSTCLLPQLFSRFYAASAKAQRRLYTGTSGLKGAEQQELNNRTVYSIERSQLEDLVVFLQLKSRYIPISLYSTGYLQDLITNKWQEIIVDNYLIITDPKGIKGLSDLELLQACLQRGLIDLTKLIQYSKNKQHNLIELIDKDTLRLNLLMFINNCLVNTNGVGLMLCDNINKTLTNNEKDTIIKIDDLFIV